jgi:glycosyltransferase involved in cell wall biosynthesis
MIYLSLPTGATYGWGVCGKYISQEMARIAPVKLLTGAFTAESVGDELDYDALTRLLPGPDDLAQMKRPDGQLRVDGPLLTAIDTIQLTPRVPNLRGTWTVGYTFYEDRLITPEGMKNARECYDHIVAGSSACEERLRAAGLENVSTVIQGIDPTIFHPLSIERRYFSDRFVVFSGGKLELRKGQDVVVRAYKVLQDKHPDVMLVTAWNNPWPKTMESMRSSRLVRFEVTKTEHAALVNEFLSQNGIDVTRTLHIPARPNVAMARIYRETDVGLFPNRCEGGTNLVLMEYMACGKPVIASYSTGHRDVLTDANSIPLKHLRPINVLREEQVVAVWDEPDLDETVAALEYAYAQRGAIAALGRQAGQDLQQFTWRHTAQGLYERLLGGGDTS